MPCSPSVRVILGRFPGNFFLPNPLSSKSTTTQFLSSISFPLTRAEIVVHLITSKSFAALKLSKGTDGVFPFSLGSLLFPSVCKWKLSNKELYTSLYSKLPSYSVLFQKFTQNVAAEAQGAKRTRHVSFRVRKFCILNCNCNEKRKKEETRRKEGTCSRGCAVAARTCSPSVFFSSQTNSIIYHTLTIIMLPILLFPFFLFWKRKWKGTRRTASFIIVAFLGHFDDDRRCPKHSSDLGYLPRVGHAGWLSIPTIGNHLPYTNR